MTFNELDCGDTFVLEGSTKPDFVKIKGITQNALKMEDATLERIQNSAKVIRTGRIARTAQGVTYSF